MKWLRAWYRYSLLWSVARGRDKVIMWIAWHLPERLVMWCYIRVGAHATTGKYGSTVVPELGMMEALRRWPAT